MAAAGCGARARGGGAVMGIEWRMIAQAPGYEVSRCGLVRNAKTGQLIAGHILRNGYRQVNLFLSNTDVIYRMAHRLVAEAFIGPIPHNKEVNHKDGDKLNNHVNNLEYVTHRENMRHAIRILGNPGGKLTQYDVSDIRQRLAARERHKKIADRYGISAGTVTFIARGLLWHDPNHTWTDGRKKLTVDNIKEIRRRLAHGEVHARIAEDYFVSDSTIDNIANGKSWSWVKG
jgi:hypothetical protein